MREVLGMMELVCILILMVVIQIHMCAKTCVTIHPPKKNGVLFYVNYFLMEKIF